MLEETSVLDGRPKLEITSVVLEGILEVPVLVTVLDIRSVVLEGMPVEVEESVSLLLVKVAERQSVVTDRSEAENGKTPTRWSRGGRRQHSRYGRSRCYASLFSTRFPARAD